MNAEIYPLSKTLITEIVNCSNNFSDKNYINFKIAKVIKEKKEIAFLDSVCLELFNRILSENEINFVLDSYLDSREYFSGRNTLSKMYSINSLLNKFYIFLNP